VDVPWSPKVLGSRRRAQLSGPAAAAEAVALCQRRLRAKLQQLAFREAMPPPLRAALRAHIGGQIAQCADQTGAPAHAAVVFNRAAARATPRPTPASRFRGGAERPAGATLHGDWRGRQAHAETTGHPGSAAAPAASARSPRSSATRARSGSAPPLASVRAVDRLLGRPGARGLPMLPRAAVDLLWASPLVGGCPTVGVRATRGPARPLLPAAACRPAPARPTASPRATPSAALLVPVNGADGTPPRRGGPGRALVAPPCTPAVATAGGGGILSRRVGMGAAAPSLPPSRHRLPRSLLAATALAAAVPLPGGGLLFRSRPSRATARQRRPPARLLVGGGARLRTRAAVAAAAAAAAEARRDSLTPAAAALGPSDPAAVGAAGEAAPFIPNVSVATRNE